MTLQERIGVSTAPEPYRVTQRDYKLLDESGAFVRYAKTELIEGKIVAVNAQHAPHIRVQSTLFRALANACDAIADGPKAWIDGSIDLAEFSMPQPDIFIADTLPDKGAVPLSTVRLMIEIADTSLRNDLNVKTPLYANAGIAEYWVVDVEGRVIHQMWGPIAERYAERRTVAFGERIEAATVAGLTVNTGIL